MAAHFGARPLAAELAELLPRGVAWGPPDVEVYLRRPPAGSGWAVEDPRAAGAIDLARETRRRRGEEYLRAAETLVRGPLRWLLPSIRCVGVSGSAAYGEPSAGDDLDFFVVTRAGATAWFLGGTYFALRLRKWRSGASSGPAPCFNYVVDERRVARDFSSPRGLLQAREALTVRVLVGDDYYRGVLARNPWIGEEIPQLFARRTVAPGDPNPRPAAWAIRAVSALCFLPLAAILQVDALRANAAARRRGPVARAFRMVTSPDHIGTRSRKFEALRARYAGDNSVAAPGFERDRPGSPWGAGVGPAPLLWLRASLRSPVPLRFWRRGTSVYVVSGERSNRWPYEVLRAGGCQVALSGGAYRNCRAELVSDDGEVAEVRAGFTRAYGREFWDRYFGRPTHVIRVILSEEPRRPPALGLVREEFDHLAPAYVSRVTSNPLQRYLKGRSVEWLTRELAGIDPLLEVGPGPGLETLPLLEAGHRIVAVDVSPRMLEQLRARAEAAGWGDRLVTRVGTLGDLGRVVGEFGPGYFGAVYSTFGAFNLEPDLRGCGEALRRAVRPGGRLLFTTLARPGAAPLLWSLAHRRAHEAISRLRGLLTQDGAQFPMDVHLRSPPTWDRILTPGFERTAARPLSVLAPPFDLPRLRAALSPAGARRVRALDAVLSRRAGLTAWSEWVRVEYRRTDEGIAHHPPRRRRGSPG